MMHDVLEDVAIVVPWYTIFRSRFCERGPVFATPAERRRSTLTTHFHTYRSNRYFLPYLEGYRRPKIAICLPFRRAPESS